MCKENHSNNSLLPFPIIVAATCGDVDAINAVLQQFRGYINVLSTRRLFDEHGNTYLLVDDEMRQTLETKLITRILSFKVA